MRISLEGIDTDLRKLMVRTRVKVELEFDVESVSLEHISGECLKCRLLSSHGVGGLDPTVVGAENQLRSLRTMGTHG